LLFATVATALAQSGTVVVSAGDWFKYGNITVNWNSNDTSATPPAGVQLNGATLTFNVTTISGTNVTGRLTTQYKNGTEITSSGWVDVDTGDGANLPGLLISANLNAGDAVYSAGSGVINETIPRTYPSGVRDTNHLNISDVSTVNATQFSYSENLYWDKSTGVFVEESFNTLNQTGTYTTTLSEDFRITDSSLGWVVPEFPAWTSTLLILVMSTPAIIAIHKRRLLRRPLRQTVSSL